MRELNKLRDKYNVQLAERFQESNKKILPYFFSHISRQKGYYDPVHKKYVKHETSMDYLQSIVTGFRIKHPQRKEFLPFVNVLDVEKYDKRYVNMEQTLRIIDAIREYSASVRDVYNNSAETSDVKRALQLNLYDELVSKINSERIGYNTMYYLLGLIEDNEYRDVKHKLLTVLFQSSNEAFCSALKISSGDICYLIPGNGQFVVYGQRMEKVARPWQSF